MTELRIEITRRADGGSVLRCGRADGSATWQRIEGTNAAFFPLHDLTHYAVETVLGFRLGFFGLIADGWDIDDTTGKGTRGPLPPEAVLVEHIVGFLDVERAGGAEWTAEEYEAQLRQKRLLAAGTTPAWLTDAALEGVRSRRRELFETWAQVAPGAAIELTFERASKAG